MAQAMSIHMDVPRPCTAPACRGIGRLNDLQHVDRVIDAQHRRFVMLNAINQMLHTKQMIRSAGALV